MTRPAPAPEYVPSWALHRGMVVSDDAHPAHELATTETCRDGIHMYFTDGTETVVGVRHMWTVTAGNG